MKVNALVVALLCMVVAVKDSGAASEEEWSKKRVFGLEVNDELKCDANLIQTANHDYLRKVLNELMNTTYFRLFRVQLDGPCPLDPPKEEELETEAETEKCQGDPTVFSFSSGPAAVGAGSSLFSQKESSSCHVEHTPVDMRLSATEDLALQSSEEDCNDERLPSFWLDLCSKLPFKHASEGYVNLKLNPETYTGYNGTKEWAAIYSENCFEDVENEMCYEERFLYRLLSGMHSSINLHISHKYYPPRKGVRDEWEPNLERFERQFSSHEDRFKNLQFAFVVMLRAIRRASTVLEKLNYETINPEETVRTKALVKLFVDAHVLSSCQGVFEAFDESLLFEDSDRKRTSTMSNLKRRFKGIFHNISSTFDCVKCQKCRLHGKLQLLGIGTAIKVLLLPPELIQNNLSREEVVALFNTVDKFSESLEIYQTFRQMISNRDRPAFVPHSSDDKQGAALKAIVSAIKRNMLSPEVEDRLVDATLDQDKEVMLLAEHFALNMQEERFIRHAVRRVTQGRGELEQIPDVVVIGAGLSGLTATITLLDRGGRVVLIDKEPVVGGNSAKASSGINGIDDRSIYELGDSVELFREDVLRGSGHAAEFSSNPLVDVLTQGSVDSLDWLRKRIGLPLEEVGQLGGHSRPRTWRPSTGLAGSEIIAGLNKALKDTAKKLPKDRFTLHSKTKVTRIVEENGQFKGVECLDLASNKTFTVLAHSVVIATGGFSFHNTPNSLLVEVRPDLKNFGTTNGKFATGDGIRMATAVGAATIDIDQVQVHPTAFVDQRDKLNPIKTLAAELLRGVGGVILLPNGTRFVNELGTRKFVSETMLASQPGEDQPEFLIVLNQECAANAPKHIPMYVRKGLLTEFKSLKDLANEMNMPLENLKSTVFAYDQSAGDQSRFPDPFGRVVFPSKTMSSSPVYYAGWITPAIHYTMGGLKINKDAQVLAEKDGEPLLQGKVFAIGETTGGIHGENRLGGNGLTECAVFGRHVGLHIPLQKSRIESSGAAAKEANLAASKAEEKFSLNDVKNHDSEASCWVAIKEMVYDFTDFIEHHPAGPEAILNLCGKDGTTEFMEIHSLNLLEDFEPLGKLI